MAECFIDKGRSIKGERIFLHINRDIEKEKRRPDDRARLPSTQENNMAELAPGKAMTLQVAEEGSGSKSGPDTCLMRKAKDYLNWAISADKTLQVKLVEGRIIIEQHITNVI